MWMCASYSRASRPSNWIAAISAAGGRLFSHVRYPRGSPSGASSRAGSSACTSSGSPSDASTGSACRRSSSVTCSNSSTPEGDRKLLNPSTPDCARGARSAEFPGTTPPQRATSTWHFSCAACLFASSPATVVVAGTLFSGISTSVVTPPAAAARVACSNPSQSARPGSLT